MSKKLAIGAPAITLIFSVFLLNPSVSHSEQQSARILTVTADSTCPTSESDSGFVLPSCGDHTTCQSNSQCNGGTCVGGRCECDSIAAANRTPLAEVKQPLQVVEFTTLASTTSLPDLMGHVRPELEGCFAGTPYGTPCSDSNGSPGQCINGECILID